MSETRKIVRKCPDCGHPVNGNFCSNCGFEVKKKKITVKSLLTMFFESKSSLNLKLYSTVRDLFIRPAPFIVNYLRGRRNKYAHPIKYLLLTTGINVGIIVSYGLFRMESTADGITIINTNPSTFDIILEKYGQFFYILFIPFFGLFSLILDSKSKYKIAERAVIFTYITAQISLVAIPLNLIVGNYHPFDPVQSTIMKILPLVYLFIIERYIFRNSIFNAIWKAILLMVLLVCAIAVILGIIYIIFPE